MPDTSRASLGYVTSYGAARRGGYTGTYEEWCALMAEVADHLEQNQSLYADTLTAKGAAEDAKTAAETAQGKAEDAQAAAEAAQGAAETAQETAEAWAAGTSGGTPGADNNAAYFATQAGSSATAAAGSASDAEAFGAGTRGGDAVTSGDDAYHNNAKYYSEQAGTSATAAAASASTAAAMGANFAPDFSASTAYTAGQYVMKDGTLYRFTADHAAGAWTGSDAEADKIAPEVAGLRDDVDYVTNAYSRDYTVEDYVHKLDDSDVIGTLAAITSAWIDLESGFTYAIDVSGTYFNRFIIVGANSKDNGATCTRLYSAGSGSYTHKTYEYTADGTYRYLLVIVNNATGSSAYTYNATFTYRKEKESSAGFKVNGIRVYTPEETSDKIRGAVKDTTGNTRLSAVNGGYIDLSGETADTTSPVASGIAQYAAVLCGQGDAFTVMQANTQALTGASVRAYGFLASDGTVLDVVDAWQNITTEQLVYAPANAAYFVANSLNDELIVYSGEFIHESVEDISDDIDYVTNSYKREYTVSDYVNKYDNSGKIASGSAMTAAFIRVEAGYTYKLTVTGTFNRLIVSGCNGKTTGSKCTRIYTKSSGVQSTEEYTYTCDGTYGYIIVLVNYNTGSSVYSGTFTYVKAKTADDFRVNGVKVYTAEEMDGKLDFIANASETTVTVEDYVHKLDNNDVIGTLDAITSAWIDLTSGNKYTIDVSGTYFNRFNIVGTNSKENGSESTRLHSGGTGSRTHETYEYTADGTYKYLLVTVNYRSGESSTYNAVFTYTEEHGDGNLKINGIKVYTAEQSDKLMVNRHRLGVTTVQLGGDTPADDVKNLSLFATKVIYSEGCVPETTGYLYVDDATQKFYYSAPTPYTPKYIFDWNTTASGGSRYEYFSATITADGDIIFLRNFTRWTPIIYSPDGQGVYSAQIIQFSQDDKRPYAWLMGSSVVQFADGSFVFGDYAYHSETDEANDDGRIIWRVTKPYTTVANWQKVHTFKHVYSTHHQSDEPDNEIGHIHAIMYDFYSDDLYCTTGDIDRHCRLWISEDHGATWAAIPGAVGTTEDTTVQAEGQKWRMTNCVFTEDAMWWATDAQYPYHLLWKCTRDASGHVDTSTLTEAADLEVPVLPNGQSQRTYITALMRDKNGLLFVDRGEPRGDKLDIKFYSFETGEVYTAGTFVRAETDASDLDSDGTRIGLPQQVTSVYQPQCMRGIITGGGKIDRPNITGLFNNAQNHYVGTLILEL